MSPNSLASVPCSTGADADPSDCYDEDDAEYGYDTLLMTGPIAPLGDEVIDSLASFDSGKSCHFELERDCISWGKKEALYTQCKSQKL